MRSVVSSINNGMMSDPILEQAKRNAAEKAVESITDGMLIGLGSGSTASYAIEAIGRKVNAGLKISAVASSVKSEFLAGRFGIRLIEPGKNDVIDLAIDGADEVDTSGNMIKGGGGSLLREKILAYGSKRFHVMVDESKLVERLGKFSLPVEVVPFASELTMRFIKALGCEPVLRKFNGNVFTTDNGNLIVDCAFGEIKDAAWLDMRLKMIPGVVETGLFSSKSVTRIFVGLLDGTVKEIGINP